ncbi:3-ketoacyl-CoA thiolase [Furfurilactobacillus rossiae]|uniref:thiolase family protein n=1 Tax=Furfurilactobacillus rossiae TaxID=231049 RepID=UPI0015BE4670|nr:acetyl-CoA C-acyltransferase [Furfurilactobacillus rossiae]MCF6166283.1 acetyl-CoA C-acyltransferase [Furfurilactobacillus rossiae]QLE65152.1 3-ketoacyl-CoA thiolase [Furfurilactobacillus rossiae]
MDDVVIVSAVRTPVGKMGGVLASFSAVELGTLAAKAAIKRAKVNPSIIDQTIVGNVLQAGSGQNVGRQIGINAGVPESSPAMTVNEVCGSGLKAIRLGQSAIVMGDADAVLVVGTESMTNAPYLTNGMRLGTKFGDTTMVDSMEHDGLTDAFSNQPMGVTAENVAEQYHVSREQQDAFALASHQRAAKASDDGAFADEMLPLSVKNRHGETVIDRDETIREDTSLEKLAKLRPSFELGGTVTAGNAAPLNDGAAAMILMRKSKAGELGLKPLATIKGYQEVGVNPQTMGYSPVKAVSELLTKQHQTVSDIDLFELNEAFAAPSVAVARDLKIPAAKLNPNGGSIAIGHPLGATGVRIVTTLIYALKHADQHTGVAGLCIGGGLGIALSVEVN